MKDNLSKMYHKSVSTSTISRHLHEYGYKNVLPQSTHILTSDEKNRRVQWAKKHKNDDFTHTIFTDESLFQIFRNTIRR
jgi:transposase-like protein